MSDSLFPRMVQEYYVQRARRALAGRARRLERVLSGADLRRYQKRARKQIAECFGPLPERTPLNAATTGVLRRKHYTVEKVLFESRPEYKVSAALYVPRGEGPFPVVLEPCGHSPNGKAYASYQKLAGGLARRGYMVFCYDPVGQGERVQLTETVSPYRVGDCCSEHNVFGNRMALLGDFFGAWRLWDGIRALDYLLSRPGADATRVGIVGCSGGGTLTSFISAFDERITMAACSCYVTGLLCNIENELPCDSEQTPPGMLAAGLDIADFHAARAPRPLLLLGERQDYFDVRGLRAAYEDLRRLYAVCGAEDDVQLVVGEGGHGLGPDQRRAIYRFFAARSDRPADVRPSEGRAEPDDVLHAAPGGSVLKAGSRNLGLFVRDAAWAARAVRPVREGDALREAVRETLALPEREGVPHYRVLRPQPRVGERYAHHDAFSVETESGILAVLHVFSERGMQTLSGPARATVYVPHVSSEDDVRDGLAPEVKELFAVDVRGLGASMPETGWRADFFHPYAADYMYAVQGQMLREPYLGRRVHDLLCVLDLLEAVGCRKVHLVGRGIGAVTAAFAACLHSVVRRATLRNAPASYAQMCEQAVALWPRSVMVQGLLQHLDLPDVYRLLRKEKRLRLLEPWDHLMGAR